MPRTTVLAAAVSSIALVAPSFGAFTVTFAPSAVQPTDPSLQALDLLVRNDPDPVDGTRFQAIQMIVSGTGGSRAFFNVSDANGDGGLEFADLYNFTTPTSNVIADRNAGNIRPGIITAASNNFIVLGISPDPDTARTDDPTVDEGPSPYIGGVTNFTADMAVLGAAIAIPASVTPVRVARYVINRLGAFTVAGQVAGEVGPIDRYSVTFDSGGTPPTNNSPVFVGGGPDYPVTVVFGTIVTTPLPFSVTVVADDGDAAVTQNVDLNLGAIPLGLTNVTVTPAGATAAPGTFVISGLVNWVPFTPGTVDYVLPFTVVDNGTPASAALSGTVSISVIPEPATLGAVAAAGLLMIRRRK